MSSSGFSQRITKPPQDELENLCPGEEVHITCETRNSQIIAWASEEYIEQGGTQLAFGTIDQVGYMHMSPVNPNTIATLTKSRFDLNTNEHVLESRLRIIVSDNSTVTCIHVGNGMTAQVRIQVLGMYLYY